MVQEKIFNTMGEYTAWLNELIMQGSITEQFDGDGSIRVTIDGFNLEYIVTIIERRGGAREGAGRKSKGNTTPLHCRVKAEVKEKLQTIADQRGQSITEVIETMVMREV